VISLQKADPLLVLVNVREAKRLLQGGIFGIRSLNVMGFYRYAYHPPSCTHKQFVLFYGCLISVKFLPSRSAIVVCG
jgi:hypothetical protein